MDLPATPWRPEPTVPASRAHVRVALQSAGRDWLVGREENGRETWLPGPALGGVVTARTVGSWLAFDDAAGATLHRVFWPAWGDWPRLEQVRQELAGRGYEVVHDPRPEPTGPPWRPPPYIVDQMQTARDGGPHRLFLAGGLTPLVAAPLVLVVADGVLSPLAAVPAVLAVVLTTGDSHGRCGPRRPDWGRISGKAGRGPSAMVIRYDLAALEHTQRGLETLAADDGDARNDDDVRAAVGTDEVAHALDAFTDGWTRRRDKQVAMIEAAARCRRPSPTAGAAPPPFASRRSSGRAVVPTTSLALASRS